MSLFDLLRKSARLGRLPTPRYFWTRQGWECSMQADGAVILPLYKSIPDAEEGKIGLGMPKDAELQTIETLQELAAAFGYMEERVSHVALNPPPNMKTKWEAMSLGDYFDFVRRAVV